jgi:hypothetical protein
MDCISAFRSLFRWQGYAFTSIEIDGQPGRRLSGIWSACRRGTPRPEAHLMTSARELHSMNESF